MKASELRKTWKTKDNTRVVKKQISIRLPTHVTAKIQALCDMHPAKTKTDIIVDLISAALDEVYDSFAFSWGNEFEDHQGVTFVTDNGERKTFIDLANKHFKDLEIENGNHHAINLYEDHIIEKQQLMLEIYGPDSL